MSIYCQDCDREMKVGLDHDDPTRLCASGWFAILVYGRGNPWIQHRECRDKEHGGAGVWIDVPRPKPPAQPAYKIGGTECVVDTYDPKKERPL